jgi:hypothetical protein
MAKPVTQPEVDDGCAAARDRYAAMDSRTASLMFSYELQGYVAASVETHGMDFLGTLAKVGELLDMLYAENGALLP